MLAVTGIWARHSSASCALFGAERNLHMEPAYSALITKGLSFDSFVDLLMQIGHSRSRPLSWVMDLHQLASATVTQLEDIWKNSSSTNSFATHDIIVSAMLDICSELSFELLFDRLSTRTVHHQGMELYKQNLLMSLRVSSGCIENASYEQCCWARGTAPADKDIIKALQLLPQLKGLHPPSDTANATELQLYQQTVHLLRLVYLHKWTINRIFTWKGDESDTLNRTEIIECLALCDLMEHIGASKTARLSL